MCGPPAAVCKRGTVVALADSRQQQLGHKRQVGTRLRDGDGAGQSRATYSKRVFLTVDTSLRLTLSPDADAETVAVKRGWGVGLPPEEFFHTHTYGYLEAETKSTLLWRHKQTSPLSLDCKMDWLVF